MPKADDVLANGIQDYPPLPVTLPENSRRSAGGQQLLADGCYFIAHATDRHVFFQGTMRVESRSGQLSASGDLYFKEEAAGPMPPPGPGIPIFPIADYLYYLGVTKIEPTESGFALSFDLNRYVAQVARALNGAELTHWVPQGSFTAQMSPAVAPAGHPKPELFFLGDVSDGNDLVIGQLQMGWMSSALRKATIEIDRMADSELPAGNGAEVTWDTVFNHVGWEVLVDVSESDITKDGDPAWTGEEAHAAMLKHRDRSDLDAEWRYHILAVHKIKLEGEQQRGWMYDTLNFPNNRPREGLLLASHFVYPEEARWGALRGVRAGDSMATYFRTAVHELGHALGLDHDHRGVSFMRPTNEIADVATAAVPFPTNIEWSYSAEHEHRLRHWPDIIVRPGGLPFGEGPIAPLGG